MRPMRWRRAEQPGKGPSGAAEGVDTVMAHSPRTAALAEFATEPRAPGIRRGGSGSG